METSAPAAVLFTGIVTESANQYLATAGFALEDPVPAMAVDINASPAVDPPSDCEWLRVTTVNAPEFTRAMAAGFDLPLALARRFSPETLGLDPAALGYRTGVLQPSAAGYSVYCGLGFREVGSLSVFIRATQSA